MSIVNRIALHVSILAALAALTAACQKESDSQQNAKVLARLDAIDKKLDQLAAQRPAQVTGAMPPRRAADPNTVYAVPVLPNDLIRGNKNAKVTIVEAHEFACPYCQGVANVVDKIVETRGADVRVVPRQFVVHPQVATNAALGHCAAVKQGKGEQYDKELWARAWTPAKEGAPGPQLDRNQLAPEGIEKLAADLKLDLAKFKADMGGEACKAEVDQGRMALAQVGVSGTPAFYINGRPYTGPRTVEGFNAAIDAEIKRVDDAVKAGAKLEDYYANLMKDAKKTL